MNFLTYMNTLVNAAVGTMLPREIVATGARSLADVARRTPVLYYSI